MLLKTLILVFALFDATEFASVTANDADFTDGPPCYRILFQTTEPGKHYVYYATDASTNNWVTYPGREMWPSTIGGDYPSENGWFEYVVESKDIPSYSRGITHFKYVFATENHGKLTWFNNEFASDGNFHGEKSGYALIQNLKYQSPLLREASVFKDKTRIRIEYNTAPLPYVYWRPCGGEWPKDHGVAMQKSHSNGFNCDYDLFTHEFNTTCVELSFHDGNGSWDSNNGQNYHLDKPGTWTFYNYLPGTGRNC